MKIKPPKIENGKMWAYYAPSGDIQVRSIAETKKQSRQYINWNTCISSYKDYEKEGYVLRRIYVQIFPK